jgi:hypothetical protein
LTTAALKAQQISKQCLDYRSNAAELHTKDCKQALPTAVALTSHLITEAGWHCLLVGIAI